MNKQQREEILRNDLGFPKINDKLWSSVCGVVKVTALGRWIEFPISVKGGDGLQSMTRDGKSKTNAAHPLFFKTLDHCAAYFQALKEQEEEANQWTWEKIQACDKIGYGSYFFDPETKYEKVLIIHKNDCSLNVIPPDEYQVIGYSSRFIFKECSFYNNQGDLIDPRDY